MKLPPLSLLLCSAMLLSSSAEGGPKTRYCPQGWTGIQGRCFKYVPRSLSWSQAEKNCLLMKGNLASVHSIEEYHKIQRLIQRVSHELKQAWIGGFDAAEEGVWFWTDGSLVSFSTWCPGEPNNGHGRNQHCLQMNHSAEKCWDDVQCNVRLPSVCVLNRRAIQA